MALLRDGETIEDLLSLSPQEILERWVNYQLEKAGSDRRVKNFKGDIKDSVVYGTLIKQIAPPSSNVNTLGLTESDLTKRAEKTLEQADKIGCREFVTARDVVNGQEKLNLAFVANLFNNYPALEEPEEPEVIQETREEKSMITNKYLNSTPIIIINIFSVT